jgi:hypothetical protein
MASGAAMQEALAPSSIDAASARGRRRDGRAARIWTLSSRRPGFPSHFAKAAAKCTRDFGIFCQVLG